MEKTMIDSVNRGKVSFWDLSSMERKSIVEYRKNNSKYVVFDYARSKDEKDTPSFGIIYKLGKYVDMGFVHGFTIDFKECKGILSREWEEISVYQAIYPLDEEFEGRTTYPYHIFSDISKAIEYSKKCRAYANRSAIANTSLYDVLAIVRKYDKSFSITKGKRNYEVGVEYEAIANGTTTIFRISDKGEILMLRGQMFDSYTFPHLDLLDAGLEYYYGKGASMPSEDLNRWMGMWCFVN